MRFSVLHSKAPVFKPTIAAVLPPTEQQRVITAQSHVYQKPATTETKLLSAQPETAINRTAAVQHEDDEYAGDF